MNPSLPSGNPAGINLIGRAVARLEAEDVRFNNLECRSSIRRHFVRPCSLVVRGTTEAIRATSQNIAEHGINLITEKKLNEGDVALLRVHSLEGSPTYFLAECRWCHDFGDDWYLSGWHFISIQRGKENSTKSRD